MPAGERDENGVPFEIAVPSTDPEKKKPDGDDGESGGSSGQPNGGEAKGKGKDDGKDQNEMSEEDLQLKSELEMLVERLKEPDSKLYMPALESLRTLIRTSTSSMTSVPKPLKFLRPFFGELQDLQASWDASSLSEEKSLLASILSVLAMTYSDVDRRDTLHYRLLSRSTEPPGSWGHEYVRHLATQVAHEFYMIEYEPAQKLDQDRADPKYDSTATDPIQKREYTRSMLVALAMELVDFFLKHNAEADAVDVVIEVENIQALLPLVDEKTYERVCRYMVSCAPLLEDPEDRDLLSTAAEIYAKHDRYPEALALAVRMNDRTLVRKYFDAPQNPVMKKQLAYFLARSQVPISWVHTAEGTELEGEGPAPEQSEDMLEALGNVKLSQYFRSFGKGVGVAEPKIPEDIYKSHLETGRQVGPADTTKANLAATFVNAFVNAGFGNDKLLVGSEEGQSWIYQNKEDGMLSATASIGMSMLWDSEAGIDHVDKYSYSEEERIKAGALLATGILHSGIRAEPDVAFALLEEHVDNQSAQLKIAAINGIAIAYAGSQRRDVAEKLLPHVADETNTMEVASMAALALGFVFVGTADGDIASAILQTLMEREEAQLDSEWTIFLGLALGLIFLGTKDASEAALATLKAIEHHSIESIDALVFVCSYAGTGDVLKIQKLQQILAVHAEQPKKEDAPAATTNGNAADETAVPAASAETTAAQDAEGDVNMSSGVEASTAQVATETAAETSTTAASAAMTSTEGDSSTTSTAPATDASATDATAGAAAAAPAPAATEDASADEDTDNQTSTPSSRELKHQAIATIGIALVVMGEEIGCGMAVRQLQLLMTYGDAPIRRAVPLALGLISASNPQLPILDTLSKYSHDSDLAIARNAILAMGFVGAGTNNARLAQMLRGLATYYAREPDSLFMVRIAQGLVHMGKGTIGLNPFFHDGQIMSRTAVAGLLSVLVSFTDAKKFVLGKNHWMLYWLVTAMYPQFLIMLDEKEEEKEVTVRVGQAVNTVGLAGTRTTISGFQTHQTPVRIGTGERAELGTNEFFPYQSVLEGLVIVKKNDAYDAEDP